MKLIICITIILLLWLSIRQMKEGMQGYSALVKKEPDYTIVPDLATSIGGRKGMAFNNSHGMYQRNVEHAKTGTPNKVKYQRTFLKPSSIGFSHNSIVNRNVYSDFYNNIDERRKNPYFKYITRFNGLNLHPARYAVPEYKFATI